MPYEIDDVNLPTFVQKLDPKDQRQWVHVWNSAYDRCISEGEAADTCEVSAFRQANGVVFGDGRNPGGGGNGNSPTIIIVAPGSEVSANQTAQAQHRNVGGREFLVAPVVALKPGVLNGELVLAQEIAAHFQSWNGQPFVIGHPNQDGQDVSANDPEILAGSQVGQLFNVHLDDGALKGELWVDVLQARAVKDGEEVVNRLKSGKKLEVSTAYFRDKEVIDGTHNGTQYGSVARNLRPDHIAALLDTEGACSWEDGCGAPRINMEAHMQINVLSRARRPSYDGLETVAWEDISKTFQAYRDGFYEHTAVERPAADEMPNQVQDAPQAMRDWIASKTLIGDPKAELESDLIAFPVVNPGTNKLNAGGVRGAISRAPTADISEATVTSIQSVGRDLLEKFETQSNESPIMRLLNRIASALNINQEESRMDELVAAILKDGRLGLSEESLRSLSEETLAAIVKLIGAMETEAETPTEPGTQEEDPPTANNECLEPVLTLAQAIEKRGGPDVIFSLLDTVRANEDAQKAQLVAALVANDKCVFTQDELEALPTTTLETLSRSLTPADYSGQGGGPVPSNREQEYTLPPMFIN